VSRFHAHSGLVFIFACLFLKITGTTGGAQVLRNLQSRAGLLQEGAQKSVHVHQLNCGFLGVNVKQFSKLRNGKLQEHMMQ